MESTLSELKENNFLPMSSSSSHSDSNTNSIDPVRIIRNIIENTRLVDVSDILCENTVAELNGMLESENGIETIELRKYMLKKGIRFTAILREDATLRMRIWKVLLGVPCSFDVESFLSKVEDCSVQLKDKVRDDAFRTFKGNKEFWAKVEESSLLRILDAIATDFGYVQGMNVILGPFAYVMPELDAYYCMRTLISSHIPAYVLKNLDGVHRGVGVFDQCLRLLDGKLHSHIVARIPDLTIFSLRYIMTLLASAQPLESVLRLWDTMFAFGVHLNVVVLCVHLMSNRDRILRLNTGFKILKFIEEAPLDSEVLVEGALSVVSFLPAPLFEDLMAHPLLLVEETTCTSDSTSVVGEVSS